MPVKTGQSKSVAQWAAELGCTQETLRRAIRNRELLARRKPFGRGLPYEIDSRDMATFIEKRRTR